MFKRNIFCLCIVGSLYPSITLAQDNELLEELSLEDLFSISTDIASNVDRSILEQPSIISIIDREQILNSGARDLIDVLRMVPGFGIAHDTAGINSWGFRGIWGHEGKIALIIDNAPYNDAAWGNIQLGRHYPMELISKIEIIRGPGAAKFGNYAEMAVVKITTLAGEGNFEGGMIDTNLRAMQDNFGSAEISAAYGTTTDSDIHFSLMLHSKHANRTVDDFTNASGDLVTDQNHSPMEVFFFDAQANYKDFSIKSVVEEYQFEHNESLGGAEPMPNTVIEQPYSRFHLGADYSNQLSEQWTVNASVLYQETLSHDMSVKSSNGDFDFIGSHYKIDTERTIFSADALYQLSDDDSLSFGIEYFEVDAFSASIGPYFSGVPRSVEAGDNWFIDRDTNTSSNSFTFDQSSVFVQYENYNDVLNFTVGARYADNSEATDSVLVPRIGVSKKWSSFGIKAMYSEAFRTGDAEHLNLSEYNQGVSDTPLESETLESSEVEFHYLHHSGMYTVNFFHTKINDPIVFATSALTRNFDEIVSDGVEASWSSKTEKYDQEINISYYKGDEGSVSAQLADDGKSYLGFPTLKATWKMDYRYSETLTISPSAMFENEKYWRATPTGDVKIDSVLLVNIAFNHKVNDNLTVSASIHDLLNQSYQFPQAYGQVLYPGDSREISIGAQYTF